LDTLGLQPRGGKNGCTAVQEPLVGSRFVRTAKLIPIAGHRVYARVKLPFPIAKRA